MADWTIEPPAAAPSYTIEPPPLAPGPRPIQGQLTPGNIDLTNRPRVQNYGMTNGYTNESTSTVRSVGVNVDGKEVLLPTVSDDGRNLTPDEAVAQYRSTGKHLGIFDTPASSTNYAKQLSQQQGYTIEPPRTVAEGPEGRVSLVTRGKESPDATRFTAGGMAAEAVKPITDYPATYQTMNREAREKMATGVEELGTSGKRLSGAWDVVTGALGFVGSPIEAGLRTVVGEPLERTTGIPKEYPEFAAGLAIPYYGLKGSAPQQTVRKILAPEMMGPEAEAAAAAIRSEHGAAARTTAQSLDEIEKWHPIVNQMDDASRFNLIDYIEGGKAGPLPASTQQLATTLRKGFEARKAELQGISRTQTTNFITDYFPHMWENPQQAQNFVADWIGKEGSGRNLKGRTVPTVADGLAAGLKPKTTNPLEAYSLYVANMDKFIATEKVFEAARANQTVRYYPPGRAPPDMVKVNSRLADSMGREAYAPENWARVYNNFTSQGFNSPGAQLSGASAVYNSARMINNAMTQGLLTLSGYHAITMTQEAMINDFARAIQQMSRGDVRGIGTALKAPLSPVLTARKGHQAEQIYLGRTPGTQEARDLVQLLTEGGARMKGSGHALDYKMSNGGSLFTAWRRGALRQEMLSEAAKAKLGVTPAVGAALRVTGRALDTMMQPLFDKYIPKLKNGAMMENLADWMKANPGATREETVAAARKIVDSVDNRFGEAIHDNNFMNQTLKQSAMLSMFSYSWTMGAIKEIGGGVKDVIDTGKVLGPGMSQRTAYAIALPFAYGLWSTAYQFLKTGEMPADMQDLKAPRTGGTTETGLPERVTPPSFMKDVVGWTQHPRQEAYNKASPALKMLYDTVGRGKDWRDDPIAPPGDPEASMPANVPLWLKHYFMHVIDSTTPITVKNISKGERIGSNLNTFEKFMGFQPSGMAKTDPEGFDRMMRAKDYKAWMAKERHDRMEKSKYVGTDD